MSLELSHHNTYLPNEITLEIISIGIEGWDKITCISAALVCRWWKIQVQRLRCRRQSLLLLPSDCIYTRNNLTAHNKIIICQHGGASPLHRFWVENPSLAVYVRHIDLICLDFVLNNDQCLCPSQDCGNITLCDLFRGITSVSLKGHFSDSLLTHLNAMQLMKLVIGTGTVFHTPLPLLQLFSIACCLTTFEIHFLVAPTSMEWSSLVRADLRARIEHLTIIILATDIDYAAANSEVLAYGRFFLWLLEDAGTAIRDIKECFIQAPSRLSGFVDHFIANKAEKPTNMGIWLTGYQSEIKPRRL